jgi:hypothetical protein
MRWCFLILGCAVVSILLCPSIDAQSSANSEKPAATGSKRLCSKGKIICVSKSVTNSLVNNPFRIGVQVNSADDIEVAWEIRDSTGQVLESSSTGDYVNQPTRDFALGRTLHAQAFIFTPAKSSRGTLTLTPSRYTIQTGGVDLSGITIPVRLTTAKSTVTTLEPENPDELKGAVSDWVQGEEHPEFNPKLKLVARQIEVMRFNRTAIIGATAEAVLRSFPGQGPWHVTHWQQSRSTAHVTLVGDGWAGVTYYATEVSYLIKESVLNLPGIKKLVFDGAQCCYAPVPTASGDFAFHSDGGVF